MPEGTSQKTVFLSYRREVSSFHARAVFQDLRQHGYDVFMDVESINAGEFAGIIMNQIAARAHFLIICTPGSFNRCVEPGDWLRREIEEAMRLERNIVPLRINDFDIRSAAGFFTGDLQKLPKINGLNVPHDYFDEAMARLRNRFLTKNIDIAIQPAPAAQQIEVERKIEKAANQPGPTEDELTAEEYFYRAAEKVEHDNYESAIADYTQAIKLRPKFPVAYSNRAYAQSRLGKYEDAVTDCTEAIEIDPNFGGAYINRGLALFSLGKFQDAITDFSIAIQLDPDDAEAYSNRAASHHAQASFQKAIADCTRAIQLNPELVIAYLNRAVAHYSHGNYEDALNDFSMVIQLQSDDAEAYSNRGELYFASGNYEAALNDFQKSNSLRPAFKYALAGLAISHHAMGQIDEAKRIWIGELVKMDERYMDADWVGKELLWRPELIEEARKLIEKL